MNMIFDKVALLIVIIGALNCGALGLFQVDAIAWLFGGQAELLSRIVYICIAAAGIWCVSILFRGEHQET